uniref:Uncharacterized protein n=1 Tax=Gracilaria ferox TaxID=1184158 RepID=A0A346Q008_9FLOR|nr:hypothetical protein [Gracilaria ferox]
MDDQNLLNLSNIHSNNHLTEQMRTAQKEVELHFLIGKAVQLSNEIKDHNEIVQRKQKKREIQKKYIKQKKKKGFTNLNCWIRCNIETCQQLKNILTSLSESEVKILVAGHINILNL